MASDRQQHKLRDPMYRASLERRIMVIASLVAATSCTGTDDTLAPTSLGATAAATSSVLLLEPGMTVRLDSMADHEVFGASRWRVSDSTVARVTDGVLRSFAEGEAVLTGPAQFSSGVRVLVQSSASASTMLTVRPSVLTLNVGQSRRLDVTVAPPRGLDRRTMPVVRWRSADTSVAAIADGEVQARKPGNVMIFATLGSAVDTVELSVRQLHQIPATIDTTGTTDVTNALNAYFRSVPDSSEIHFVPFARYRVEGTLLFVNRRHLTLQGNGATVFATTTGAGVTPPASLAHRWPRGRRHFLFQGGAGITVRNVKVRGANPVAGTSEPAYVAALEAQHGFEFSGVEGGELDRVTVNDVYGDFVYFGPYTGNLASGIRVHHSTFERNGRQGVAFTGAQDILFEQNAMSHVRRAHFDLEPNLSSDVVRRITIRDNAFGPGRLLFLASGGAAGTVEDIKVERNVLTGKELNVQMVAPVGSRRSRVRIAGNSSNFSHGNPMGYLMLFQRVDGVEVSGNANPLQAGRNMVGVRTRESCAVVVRNNAWQNGVGESDIGAFSC